MTVQRGVVAALAMVAGCSAVPTQVEGAHYQYVVSDLRVPSDTTTALENGLDLDGNHAVDNQLGQVFSLLHQFGLGVADTAHEALLRGGVVMLVDLQTSAFDHTALAGFTAYLGGDPVPAPCLDPARLDTCGQHLSGQGSFSVDVDTASDRAVGPIVASVFAELVGRLPIEIAIDPTATLRLDLRGAHIRLTELSGSHASGVLGGGITLADVAGVVIPAAVAQMNRIVHAECAQPTGKPPCGCIDNTRAELLQSTFDDDNNCEIGAAEVSSNGLVKSILAPDIVIDGEQLLSFGVGIEPATAMFPSP